MVRSNTLHLGARTVDLRAGVVRDALSEVRLTPVEQRLLAYLADAGERSVAQDELLVHVWGYHQAVRSRTAVVTIQRLRQKLEADPANPRWLRTTPDGYQLVLEPEPADPDLLGRAADQARLAELTRPGAAVAVVGPPGVGKSRLLRAWMAGASGCVYVDAAGRTGAEALAAIALGLGVDLSVGEPVARLAGALAARRLILVIDGAEAVADALPAWLSAWSAAPEVAIALGSRVEIDGARTLPLEPLPAAVATELLLRRARQAGATHVGAHDLAALTVRLDGLPLAIELAAARLAVVSPRELLGALGTDGAEGTWQSLDSALASSWGALQSRERRLLVAIAHLPAGAVPEVVADVLGRGWLDAVAGLRRASLLRVVPAPTSDGRSLYTTLDAVRDFALRQGPTEWPEARAALVGALTRWAAEQARTVDGIDGGFARAALDHHWDNVGALVAGGVGPAEVELVGTFLGPAHRRLGPGRLERVLAAVEPAAQDNPAALAWMALSRSYSGPTAARRVLRERAVELAKQAGDDDLLCRALARFGRSLADLGAIQDGLRACEEAAGLGGPIARGEAWIDVAALLSHLDRLDEAYVLLERAGDVFASVDAPAHEGQALGQLAVTASQLGRVDAAIAIGSRAAELLDASGDARNAGVVRGNLCNAYVACGRAAEAVALASQLVEADVLHGRRDDEAYHRTALATALFTLDRGRAGVELWRARDLFRRVAIPRGEAHCAMMLGILAHVEGRLAEALRTYAEAAAIVAGRNVPAAAAEIAVRLAVAAADAGQLAEARAALGRTEGLPPAFAGARGVAERMLALGERRAGGEDVTAQIVALRSELWSR